MNTKLPKSYFLRRLCEISELLIYDVQKIDTHGGSLRVWITK